MSDDIIHDIGSAEDETNEFYHKWLDRKAEAEDLSRKLEEARHRIAELEQTDEITMAEVHDNFNELMERGDITPVQAAVYLVARERNKTKARIGVLTDLKNEASFLVDRLREWEADGCDCDRGNREWNGHVSPPLARLEGILSKLEGKSDA